MRRGRSLGWAGAGVCWGCWISLAHAEELATVPVTPLREAAAPSLEKTSAETLPSVEVFARLRPEDTLEAPVSMQVLDGERLSRSGVRSTQDLQAEVPGLTVVTPNPRQVAYTIRGLGSSGANEGLESSVGFLVDGVYLGRQGLTSFEFFDVEQIEVLKGPQGTYFGKNTTAGAIHIRTHAPSSEPEAAVTLTTGSEAHRRAEAVLGGALDADGHWSGRLSGFASRQDGTIENLFDERHFLGQSRQGLRAQLRYAPPGGPQSRSIVEWGRVRDDCCIFQLTIYRPVIRDRDDYLEYTREPVNPFARQVQLDSVTALSQDQLGLTQEWQVPFGAWTLTSLSAYRDWDFVPLNDDGASLDISPLNGTENDYQQWSQELRAERRWARTMLVTGLYGLEQDLRALDRLVIGADFIPWILGGALRGASGQDLTQSNADFGLGAVGQRAAGADNQTRIGQRATSLAAFISVDHALTEDWSMGLGLRYSQERKAAEVIRARVPPPGSEPGALDEPVTLDPAFFETFGTTDPGNLTTNLLLDQIIGGPSSRQTRYRESAWSGQTHLQRSWGSDTSAYLRLARGAKSGGINLAAVSGMVNPTFRPETINSAELGLKTRRFSGRLNSELTLYHARVDDYQALTFDREPSPFPNPRPVNLINVGEVRLQGVEWDVRALPHPALRLHFGAAWTDAITEEFTNAPDESTSTNTKDLSGQPLFNAPRWSTVLGVEGDLPGPLPLQAGLQWSYRGDTFGTVERGLGSEIPAYSLVNLRLALLPPTGGWRMEARVRNALDEDYVVAVGSLYGVGNYGATVGEPRRLELGLSRHFH